MVVLLEKEFEQRMPTILRIGPYRLFFYSNEQGEPAHIHIQRESKLAKYWLKLVALAKAIGFSSSELRKLESIVMNHQPVLLEAWNEYFGIK